MTEQLHPTGAVFLSYASEDAEAASRICDALRAAGVEVWLDKNELRGGDTWDAQIKKRIHDCALFIPLISAHTNARAEGYFRGEWHLATRRLHNMADDATFLMPVVVDETREFAARVPEEFFRAQWTWLPNGDTPPAFAQRVRELLGADGVKGFQAPSAADPGYPPGAGTSYASNRRVRPFRLAALAVIALLVLGAGGSWYFREAGDAPATKPAPAAAVPTTAVAVNEKSIAVLPFADMSAGKDQEYFADGLSEELLNLLAKLPELRVIGRTSSFQFKGRNEDLRVIGEKLNVAHILEGSVRKSGEKLRISAQLIRAADGFHLWSETYDRTLDDIFVVQDEIAGEVVQALKLTLFTPTSVTRSRPVDHEAYNLTLKGRFFVERLGQNDFERAVEYFRQAHERDPEYAPAWAGLSKAYAGQADNGYVPTADGYRRAREAAEKALALDPQLADAHLAMGWIQHSYDWNWAAADLSNRKALALEPGNAQVLRYSGRLAVTLGRWSEAIDLMNKAIERDPLQPNAYSNLGLVLQAVNRDTEAEVAIRKALELDPDGSSRHRALGRVLLLQGKTDAALREMQQETGELWRPSGLSLVFHALGRRSESDAALAVMKDKHAEIAAYQIAQVHAFRGEADLAFVWLGRAYDQRDAGVPQIMGDRLMRGLVGDPHYKAFLRKLKLPE
jgi:TolB-like protein/Tfp pilus assembly protein PilF